jgi:hypothetical protein
MWQDEFAYALAARGSGRFITALYGSCVYLPVPPRPFTPEILQTSFEFMGLVNGPGGGISRVEGLTEEERQKAENWGYPVRPALTEYLYQRSLVAELRGDPYRAKRAEVNHLVKNHQVVFRPYREKDLSSCGELFDLWKQQRTPALRGQLGEKMIPQAQKAHLRALLGGENWGLDRWVVLLGNRIAAYSAGAALNRDTYGAHLEVTDLTIKGLSAYIFANVCRQAEGYDLINAGDAEGLPRLAESKEHWHPFRRNTSYAADPKK